MIYSKIDGTTSESFKVGKDGVKLSTTDNKLSYVGIDNIERTVGVTGIRAELDNKDIPTVGAVKDMINSKMRTVTQSDLATIDLEPDDYIFVEKGGN